MNTFEVVIREAHRTDALSVAKLAMLSHSEYFAMLPDFIKQQNQMYWEQRFFKSIDMDGYAIFVAELDKPLADKTSTIVGYGELYIKRTASQTIRPALRAVIDNMVVLPDFRRRGVARKLLRQFERHAKSAGAELIELQVAVRNQDALSLYHQQGFATRFLTLEKSL